MSVFIFNLSLCFSCDEADVMVSNKFAVICVFRVKCFSVIRGDRLLLLLPGIQRCVQSYLSTFVKFFILFSTTWTICLSDDA